MKASIVDLRYHMHNILKALSRNESVDILYHRKKIAILQPANFVSTQKVEDHPFFGMNQSTTPVDQIMQHLRGGRYHDDDV